MSRLVLVLVMVAVTVATVGASMAPNHVAAVEAVKDHRRQIEFAPLLCNGVNETRCCDNTCLCRVNAQFQGAGCPNAALTLKSTNPNVYHAGLHCCEIAFNDVLNELQVYSCELPNGECRGRNGCRADSSLGCGAGTFRVSALVAAACTLVSLVVAHGGRS